MANLLPRSLFVLLLLFSFVAHADNHAQARELILQGFETHLQALKDLKVNAINRIPISEIQEKARKVRIEFVESLVVPDREVEGAQRSTAYWDPKAQTIFVSIPHINGADIKDINGIMFHEINRAVGIPDENHDASAVNNVFFRLHLLRAKDPSVIQDPKSLEVLRSRIINGSQFKQSGGISGVGGGGDMRSQAFKEAIITLLFSDLDRNRISADRFLFCLDVLAQMRFELSPAIESGGASFDKASMTILVPMNPFADHVRDVTWRTIIVPVKEMVLNATQGPSNR